MGNHLTRGPRTRALQRRRVDASPRSSEKPRCSHRAPTGTTETGTESRAWRAGPAAAFPLPWRNRTTSGRTAGELASSSETCSADSLTVPLRAFTRGRKTGSHGHPQGRDGGFAPRLPLGCWADGRTEVVPAYGGRPLGNEHEAPCGGWSPCARPSGGTGQHRDGKRVRGRQRQGVGGAGGRAEQDVSTCTRARTHTHTHTPPESGCEPGGDPAGLRWARGRGRVPAFHAPSGGAGSPEAPEAPGRLVMGRRTGRGFWCPTVTARATPSRGGSGEMAAAMVGANGGLLDAQSGRRG